MVEKNVENNVLYVAHGHQHPALNKRELKLEDLHLVSPNYFETQYAKSCEFTAVPRYRHQGATGQFDLNKMTFSFNEPQRALTSGQTLAMYVGEDLVASGTIG